MQHNDSYTVSVGAQSVTIRKPGESALRVANILSCEMKNKRQIIYLDRLLLAPGETTLNENWTASGCISTILTSRR